MKTGEKVHQELEKRKDSTSGGLKTGEQVHQELEKRKESTSEG